MTSFISFLIDHLYILFSFVFQSKEELNYYAIPVLLVCIFAYFIAHCFLSTYEVRKKFLKILSKVYLFAYFFLYEDDVYDTQTEMRFSYDRW